MDDLCLEIGFRRGWGRSKLQNLPKRNCAKTLLCRNPQLIHIASNTQHTYILNPNLHQHIPKPYVYFDLMLNLIPDSKLDHIQPEKGKKRSVFTNIFTFHATKKCALKKNPT